MYIPSSGSEDEAAEHQAASSNDVTQDEGKARATSSDNEGSGKGKGKAPARDDDAAL